MARELSTEEREVMRWAGRAFRRPWFAFCDASQRIASGTPHPSEAYRFDPFFLPVSLDARPIVWLMKSGLTNVLLGPNASLFTVVLDQSGERILWCGVEREEGGAFVEYHVLNDRLDEPWAARLLELLREDRMDDAFRFVYAWVKSQTGLAHIDVGVLKVAHLPFFAALKRAWEESSEGRQLLLFTAKALDAVREIVDRRWLRFAPPVNLDRLLRTLAPGLRLTSALNRRYAQRVLERVPL